MRVGWLSVKVVAGTIVVWVVFLSVLLAVLAGRR
jgi:hypothetical protein